MIAYLQYLVMRGFSVFVNLLPENSSFWIGRRLGWIAYHLDRRHRKVALDNLRLAFGREKPEEELQAIAQKTFEHLGLTTMEFFRIPRMDIEIVKERVTIEGAEIFERMLSNNAHGILLLLSHLGNWELMGLIPKAYGLSISVLARPIKKNKWLDRWVLEIRRGAGLDVLSTERASRKVLRALSEKRLVGILIDQRAKRSEGIMADFFGKEAPTTPALAVLAMRTGAPVVPVFMIREGEKRHRFMIQEPLPLTVTGDIKKDIEANVELMNRTLESMVRKYPDQWFWIHQRWERKKKGSRIRPREVRPLKAGQQRAAQDEP
jgi:Kdo2-lipid IVA lauroyltransferase/acyltransferase